MIASVTRGLASAIVTVMLAGPPGLGSCNAKRGAVASETPPPPLPSTTATAPPIWTPPETAPAPAPVVSTDLAKARQLAQAGDNKKVRLLLEKKVRAGKASREEAAVLVDACSALRDRSCIDATRAKYPDAAE